MKRNGVLARLAILANATLILLLSWTLAGEAQERKLLRLGEASFEVPADWKIVRRSRDRSYTLKSPDGAYELRVEWWLPDEPLLGYADIVWHRKTTVAGRSALMIYSRFPQAQSLQVAIEQPRSDGRQLLIVLQAEGPDLANGSPLLDDVLARLRLGGGDKGARDSGPRQSTAGGRDASDGQRGDASPADRPKPTAQAVYTDPARHLTVRYPQDWSRSTTERDGLGILTVSSRDKQGLVLIVAAEAGGTGARKAIGDYEEQFYQDCVIPDSIEADGAARVGTLGGHYVEVLARVYPIEGVRVAFSEGRSWLFKADSGARSYLVAIVHARNAPAALVQRLRTVVHSLTFQPVDAAVPRDDTGSQAPAPPAVTTGIAAPDPTSDAAGAAGRVPPLTADGGCKSIDVAGWRHPMRDVLRTRGRARLEWVSLCRGGVYPVLGVAFDLDPQGATSDYFKPLYLDLLEANERNAFALVSTRDSIEIRIAPLADGGFDLDITPVEGVHADAAVRGGDGPPVERTIIDPRGGAGQRVEATAAITLFAGGMSDEWRAIAMSGGDFGKFARFETDRLVVGVPAGNVWGKTGLASVKPVVAIPGPSSDKAVALRFAFDPVRSRNFVVSLLPSGSGSGDEWHQHQIRFAITTKDGEPPELILWGERIEQARRKLKAVPAAIELQLMPDRILLLTDGAGNVLLQGALPEKLSADGYHIHAIAHARDRDGTASLALEQITLESWHFGQVVASDRPLQPGDTQTTLLFDGDVTHPHLQRFQAHGGDFAKHALIDGGSLLVDVPKGNRWGKAGLFSREPIVWFDGTSDDAETVVTFTFDTSRTTGFVAALTPVSGLNGNDPSNPRVLVHWRQTADGKALYSVYSGYDKLVDVTPETPAAPRDVKFVLRQHRVKLVLPDARDIDIAWPPAAPGQSFRLYVYSHPDKADLPVRMALTGIIVERSAGTPVARDAHDADLPSLPVRLLFDAGKPGAWDIDAIAADLKPYARIGNGRLIVDVPEKKNQWAKSGVLFRDPVMDLNERIQSTNLKFTLRFDPKATDGTQIVFSPHRIANMWGSRRASVYLIRAREGANAGCFVLGIDADAYRTWSRRIDAAWMDASWDGTLEIEITDGGLIARIPGAATVRGTDLQLRKNTRLHMVVTAHPDRPYGSARMGLVSVASQWQLPAASGTLDRWSYVDDADFKPDEFLDDLARSLDTITSNPPSSTGARP